MLYSEICGYKTKQHYKRVKEYVSLVFVGLCLISRKEELLFSIYEMSKITRDDKCL